MGVEDFIQSPFFKRRNAMTWKEIKLASLQKMYSVDGNTIGTDSATLNYIAAMPHVANEGLQLLSTSGKFILKKLEIAHAPIENMLSTLDSMKLHSLVSGTKEFIIDGAKSYYVEFYGKGTLVIKVGDTVVSTITLTSPKTFTAYKANIANLNNLTVTLSITCVYPCSFKNVALYSATFETDSDVQSFAEKIRYNVKELVDDFYMFENTDVYFEGDGINDTRYVKITDFLQESNHVLVIERSRPGLYTFYYKAYPTEISSTTLDDYELPLDREVVVLLPLYIASELYKDDDLGMSNQYRNEFEIAREALNTTNNATSSERFVSESGWI